MKKKSRDFFAKTGAIIKNGEFLTLQSVNHLDGKEIAAKKVGQNLTVLLKWLNLNQADLSDMTGLGTGQISDFVKGNRPNISWFVLYKISQALQIRVDDLISGNFDVIAIGKRIQEDIPLMLARVFGYSRGFFSRMKKEELEELRTEIKKGGDDVLERIGKILAKLKFPEGKR